MDLTFNTTIDLEKEKLFNIARKAHGRQTRSAGREPYWHHVLSVAQIIQDAFYKTGELDRDKRLLHDVLLAAIGHDLYEDTKIKRQFIKKNYGVRVDNLIWLLTNKQGDNNRMAYIEKIKKAPDEVRMIKLADLIENTICVAYNIHDLGTDWVYSFFLPIIEEMKKNVSVDKFNTYKKTARLLNIYFDFAYCRLMENVKKYHQTDS